MTWEEYEDEVYKTISFNYPNAVVRKDYKKQGTFSGAKRQIDIYVVDNYNGKKEKIAIESKYYNRKINVKIVEAFIAMLADINVDVGIMVTEKGYSKAALRRAQNNLEEIDLDILSLGELKKLQGLLAFPFAGNNAALLQAPFGWIIDATKRPQSICTLYPRGQSFEEALGNGELAYINYWDRHKNSESLTDLKRIQDERIKAHANQNDLTIYELSYLKPEKRPDAKTALRLARIQKYPDIELTGFIEFDDFIFFCVLLSHPLHIKRNIRKIRSMLRLTLPIRKEN